MNFILILIFILATDICTGDYGVLNTTESGKCEDKVVDCITWAKNGECQKNPVYMNKNCKRSCNVLCVIPVEPTAYGPWKEEDQQTHYGRTTGVIPVEPTAYGPWKEEDQQTHYGWITGDKPCCKCIDKSKCDDFLRKICPKLCASEKQTYENCAECGITNMKRKRQVEQVPTAFNGDPVEYYQQYPWQVLIILAGDQICGGTIINSRWILTARHCRDNGARLKVIVGEHRYRKQQPAVMTMGSMMAAVTSYTADDDSVNTKTYNIKRAVEHPDYVDMMLLELTKHIPFNDVIRPVCLPENDSNDYASEKEYIVTGWGRTESTNDNPSEELMIIKIPSISQCPDNTEHNLANTDNKICHKTSGPKTMTTCIGDSGGPMMVEPTGTRKMVQIGMVSSGPIEPDCTAEGHALFIRLSKYLNWIKETTSSGDCRRRP